MLRCVAAPALARGGEGCGLSNDAWWVTSYTSAMPCAPR